jgi:subtilase family serine protease
VAFISGRRLGQLVAVLVLIAAPVIYGATSAGASTRRLKVSDIVPLPARASALGAVPSAKQLHVTVALKPQNSAGLQSLLTAVSTPGSPQFRRYLTTAQFAQRFGASPAEVSAVQSALRADGLTVSAPEANGLTMSASGPTTAMERAFSTSLSQVRLHGGRVAYRNTSTPTVSGGLAGDISGVIGLQNVYRHTPVSPYRAHHPAATKRSAVHTNVATGGPQPCAAATAAAQNPQTDGYTADQLADYYDFSGLYHAGDEGAGQTVDIFELEGNYPSDIAAYQACYGTNAKVTYTKVDGGAPAPVAGSDGVETELDVETVIGLAPKASIDVYQAPPDTDAEFTDELSAIIAHGTGKVISISYGGCEPDAEGDPVTLTENNLFKEAAVEGKTVFASSGDEGSAGCDADNEPAPPTPASDQVKVSVEDPASQPDVTGVGGTVLYPRGSTANPPALWTPGTASTEGVWNDGSTLDPTAGFETGATGGGDSIFWPMPSYQSSASSSLGVINSNSASGASCNTASSTRCREVPDVSAVADPYTGYIIYYAAGGPPDWFGIGGTSGSSPLWAALATLANASTACHGASLGFLNPELYKLASSSAYGSDFHDVDAGDPAAPGENNNDSLYNNTTGDGTTGLYPVKAGYDQATGLGSPVGANLAKGLCSALPADAISVKSPGSRTGTQGKKVSLAVHATNNSHNVLSYKATGLPRGLRIGSSTGVISGKPSKAEKTRVSVKVTDAFGTSKTVKFAYKILGRPTAKSVKLSGVGKRTPRLRFTLAAGTYAPALRAVAFTVPHGVSFARKHKSLVNGITVRNRAKVKFTASVKKGVLTITFSKTQRHATVTITRPTLGVSRNEAAKVRRHEVKKVIFSIRPRDAKRTTTKISETLKKFS